MECLSTLEEITMDNYCEYQTAPYARPAVACAETIRPSNTPCCVRSMRWHPSLFAAEVIEVSKCSRMTYQLVCHCGMRLQHLLATQFQHYLENVQKADCAAALKRVVDKVLLPCRCSARDRRGSGR